MPFRLRKKSGAALREAARYQLHRQRGYTRRFPEGCSCSSAVRVRRCCPKVYRIVIVSPGKACYNKGNIDL